jgi:ribA/ribD-fused uncharacterized protein
MNTPNEIRFYRAAGEYGFLSNLFLSRVELDGRVFAAAEYAYQYAKPNDPKVAEWLVGAPKPHLCAIAAHGLLYYDMNPNWQKIKADRMRAVLSAKFTPGSALATRLLSTGEAKLIEESKTDAFWGIGAKGKGRNMLGVLLMQLRDELRCA